MVVHLRFESHPAFQQALLQDTGPGSERPSGTSSKSSSSCNRAGAQLAILAVNVSMFIFSRDMLEAHTRSSAWHIGNAKKTSGPWVA